MQFTTKPFPQAISYNTGLKVVATMFILVFQHKWTMIHEMREKPPVTLMKTNTLLSVLNPQK